MKKLYYASLLLALVLYGATFISSTPVHAATSAEAASERSSKNFCKNEGLNSDQCERSFAQGYLGDSRTESIDNTGACENPLESGSSDLCATWYVAGVEDRKQDFIESSREICKAYIDNAKDSENVDKTLRDLSNSQKDKATTACVQGYNDAIDTSLGSINNSPKPTCGSIYSNSEYQKKACAAGKSLGNSYVFTSAEAKAVAKSGNPDDAGLGSNNEGEGQGTEELGCNTSPSPISWIVCPVVELGANFVNDFFENFLRPLLEDVPVSLDPQEGSFKAWQSFRVLANIILVTAMLAIVYAQARGDK